MTDNSNILTSQAGKYFKQKDLDKMQKEMFSEQKTPEREKWLLGFAAPLCQVTDITGIPMFADCFYSCPSDLQKEYRQIFREKWGVDTAGELRELIERGIARPVAYFFDRIYTVMGTYQPESYSSVISQVVPMNSCIKKNVSKLNGIIQEFTNWGIPIPDNTLYSFDLARAATLAVQGYWLGFLEKIEAVLFLERIARQALLHYSSWEDYASLAAFGLELWRISTSKKKRSDDILKCLTMLFKSTISPYSSIKIDYGMSIHPSKPAYTPDYKKGSLLGTAIYESKEDYISDSHDFEDRLYLCVNMDRIGKEPDPMSAKYWNSSQLEMFPDALAEDLEKWLCSFGAPLAGSKGVPTNHLCRYKENKCKAIKRALKKEFGIYDIESLKNEITILFYDGMTKYNDTVYLHIASKEPEYWADAIARNIPLKPIQKSQIKNLIKVKKNIGYYSMPMPTETTYAYDLVRAAFIVMAGYGINYLSNDEAMDFLKKIAWAAARYYNTWQEYFGAYLFGRAIWYWSVCRFRQMKNSIFPRKARVAIYGDKSTCLRYTFKQFVEICSRPERIFIPPHAASQ